MDVQTLDYSFVNTQGLNELDLSGSNLEISGDSHPHEFVEVNDLDLSGGNLDISGDLHSQENADEMGSPAMSPITTETMSFLMLPLSDHDSYNHSFSVTDARNNKPPRSRL